MVRRGLPIAICVYAVAFCLSVFYLAGCNNNSTDSINRVVPHEGQWGIYTLNLSSQAISLLYSSDDEIAQINLSHSGTHLVFSEKYQSSVEIDTTSEIYILDLNDGEPVKLTDNYYFDTYPSFSPDDSQIAFLTLRSGTLDLYVMDSDGSNQQLLYNSGGHDADVDWGSTGRIVFTRDSQIWTVEANGTDPAQVTDPDSAGFGGIARLPFGDYDPRFSPDGSKIAFERMVDVDFIHGGYDIFVIDADGDNETSLTHTGSLGYAQGFPNWSHAGDRILYILSAIVTEGKYDLCMMNSDGTENEIITPSYFPPLFLCYNAVFSLDDSEIYFIGRWYED